MKIEIIERSENALLQRTDVKFKVDHAGQATPKRLDVRAQLASQLGVPEELIVIEKLASTYGRQVASGIARVYSSRERLEQLEPKYLLERGLPKAKPEEKPEVEKPPKEKPEKPKEKVEKPEEKAKPKKPEKAEPKPEEESKEGVGGKEG